MKEVAGKHLFKKRFRLGIVLGIFAAIFTSLSHEQVKFAGGVIGGVIFYGLVGLATAAICDRKRLRTRLDDKVRLTWVYGATFAVLALLWQRQLARHGYENGFILEETTSVVIAFTLIWWNRQAARFKRPR